MNPSQGYPSNAGGSTNSVTPSALVAGLAGTSVSLAALSVSGNMSVAGTTTTTNTATTISEQVVVTNAGGGPALSVTQNGAQPVALFVDGEGVVALKIWDNGLISVGSGTQPVQRLEVTGNVAVLGTGAQFIGNLSGSATTATTAASCSGNAATATTAAACTRTGNAATATTALACTGNAATATNVQWSGIQNWPVNTNKYWSADANNVWLTAPGKVGIGSTAPTVELDVSGAAKVSGALTSAGSAVMTSSYDFFTNADAPVATTGTWAYNSTNIDLWINHSYKINPNSGTLENGSGNAATADYNVPTGANTMFIQHLAYNDALYYDVLGSSDNTNFYLLKRVSNYINHTNQVQLIESINIGGINIPYTRVRIQTYANSGDCRISAIAWRASLQPGSSGLVHTSQLNGVQFGTLTVASATYYTGQATASLVFPKAFASVPTVTCTPAFNLTGVWQIFLGINSVSATGVTFGINNSGGTASPSVVVTIHWMAMA